MNDNYNFIYLSCWHINYISVEFTGPRIFSMLFAIVKPFLSENTVNKISIFDSNEANWKKAVEEVIDPSQLPIRYGGRVENPALMD